MGRKLIHKDFVGAYVYFVKVDGTVRYVGKGRRHRPLEHLRLAREINRRRDKGEKVKALRVHNSLAKAMRLGSLVQIDVFAKGMSDEEAYVLEMEIIASFPKEQLWNLHKGGSGGDAEMMRRMWADPVKRAMWTKAISAGRRKPINREQARATANAHWANPEYRAGWMAEHRAIWDDPERAAERRALLKRVWDCPEKTARKSALVKSQWTPERKAAQSAKRKAAWADPEFSKRVRAKIAATRSKPEYAEKMRNILTARWADPAFRSKISAAAGHRKRYDNSQQSLPFHSSGTEKI